MNNDNNIIPKFRFPEFKDDGNWDVDVVKNLIKTITPPKKLNSNEYLKEGDYPIVDQSKSFYCGYSNDKEALISPENDLIVFGDHTCITKYINHPFIQGADGIKIFSTKKSVLPNYFYQYLQYNPVKQEEYKRHFSILKDKVISYPTNPDEQQKIAACLSSLDDVIAGHEEKLTLLEEHKKGLMQNLFPQEGETQPKYRFPEFENDGDWVEKKLGDMAEIITGNTPKTSEKENYGEEFNFVSPADISENRYIISTKTKLSRLGLSKTRLIKPNSVIFVCIGSTIGKIAQIKEECATNQQINSVYSNQHSNDFLYSLLEYHSAKIAGSAGHHAIPIINKTDFSNLSFLITNNLAEQQKIASFLSSVDELIVAQREKIEALKEHKRGLLQGLFPKIES